MQVSCEQCGTSYRFDESKLTEKGVKVKCSHCGHLFHVTRGSAQPDTGTEEKSESWKVKKSDGTILLCDSLTTLQRWIVESRVSRDDQIMQDDGPWKSLSELPELASFFRIVDDSKKQAASYGPGGPGGA